MVNYGVSRACETCKKRHKKCDETRPICNRCAKSNRACLGYKDDSELLFRNYGSKQSLPNELSQINQLQIPCFQGPDSHQELNDSQIEEHSLNCFFDNYCVIPQVGTGSRGFLYGLQSLINHAGPDSDICQAAKIVSLANNGNKLGRRSLLIQAEHEYVALLRKFQTTLSNPLTANTVESLLTAVLLGLYEIVTSSGGNSGEPFPHLGGVCAILTSDQLPCHTTKKIELFQISNALFLNGSLEHPAIHDYLCATKSITSVQSLDSILVKFNPFFTGIGILKTNNPENFAKVAFLKQDVLRMDKDLCEWAANQSEDWRPRRVGNIDIYPDLYVAAIWNTYRKTHLIVLDLILKYSEYLYENDSRLDLKIRTDDLINGIIASIPYHLANNPLDHVDEKLPTLDTMVRGRSVGGLLLLHPLYVGARKPLVTPELRTYMCSCLAWIGKRMGISQATELSNPETTFPFKYIAEGHTLIWAGMLIQPA